MKVFISYSHRDENALNDLHTHLAMLRRESLIDQWYDRKILPGDRIDREIEENLESCNLFLALVSPDFLNSNYCYETEMQRAIEKHEQGDMRVIPLIIEPCDWKSSPLSQFKSLPKDGKPVSEWNNPNSAYLDIVTELRRIVRDEQFITNEQVLNQTSQFEPAVQERYRIRKDFDEIDRSAMEFLIHRLHAFACQGTCVLNTAVCQ